MMNSSHKWAIAPLFQNVNTITLKAIKLNNAPTHAVYARSFHAVPHDYSPGMELRRLGDVVPKLGEY